MSGGGRLPRAALGRWGGTNPKASSGCLRKKTCPPAHQASQPASPGKPAPHLDFKCVWVLGEHHLARRHHHSHLRRRVAAAEAGAGGGAEAACGQGVAGSGVFACVAGVETGHLAPASCICWQSWCPSIPPFHSTPHQPTCCEALAIHLQAHAALAVAGALLPRLARAQRRQHRQRRRLAPRHGQGGPRGGDSGGGGHHGGMRRQGRPQQLAALQEGCQGRVCVRRRRLLLLLEQGGASARWQPVHPAEQAAKCGSGVAVCPVCCHCWPRGGCCHVAAAAAAGPQVVQAGKHLCCQRRGGWEAAAGGGRRRLDGGGGAGGWDAALLKGRGR